MIKNDVKTIQCNDKNEASKKALEIILKHVDQSTLLLLSGGTSPDLLYQLIAQDKSLKPGAVAMVDERYGLPMHVNSNEKMISDTGLLDYLSNEGVPVYRILKEGDMEGMAGQYEQIIRELFARFSKKVAIMGIGSDGHTAGIKPDLDYDHTRLVVSYDDKEGYFGKRITLTFEALKQIDQFIVLIFGRNKKEAFQKMFIEKDRKIIPAAFYLEYSSKIFLLIDKIY